MTHILVIWTIVAVTSGSRYGSSEEKHWDWRPIGDFKSAQSCVEAARQLNVPSHKFRCLAK